MASAAVQKANPYPLRLVSSARALACFAGLIGALGLPGYVLGVDLLITVKPSLRGMSPLTSVILMLISAGVFAVTTTRLFLMRALAGATVALGAFILVEHGIAGGDVASSWIAARLFGLPNAAVVASVSMQ